MPSYSSHSSSAQGWGSIEMLYDLSLRIGTSLELQQNCEHFFIPFLSYGNWCFGSLYLNQSLRNRPPGDEPRIPHPQDRYRRLYAYPAVADLIGECSGELDVIKQTHESGVLCGHHFNFSPAELAMLVPDISMGQTSILTTFSLGQGAVVVVLINHHCSELYAQGELEQLRLLLERFQSSVAACLEHDDLRQVTTDYLTLETRLVRAQRMEALGLLASGIAHDLGNILNPLSVYPEFIEEYLPPDSQERYMLQQMQQSVHQVTEMMSDLLSLAQTSGGRTELVTIDQSVRTYFGSSTYMALAASYPQIDCEVQIATQAQIWASASMMTRIILNLVTNAFEAVSDHGHVVVAVFETTIDQERLGYERIPAGQYAVLMVEDDGPGIDKDIFNHIFEPFFSKKKLGRSGSGLGLAVVYGMVKAVDGFIDLETSSAGTTFLIYFSVHRSALLRQPSSILTQSTDNQPTDNQPKRNPEAPTNLESGRSHQTALALIQKERPTLSPEWQERLRRALMTLDEEQISSILAMLPPSQKELKDAILQLVQDYQYDVLLQLINGQT